nr:xylulose kinase-1 [Tanacetum cinerariifolium]
MSLMFADTHNMVAYLHKSDASEGFNQVIDFLNGSYIKYALTVNPNIYISCIKQFWNTVVVKQSNNVTRLQALVDRKRVVITKAAIREVLCLDDAEGVDCLPNEEILLNWLAWVMRSHQQSLHFIRLSSQASGSRKFNFSKYIFESLVRNVDSSSKFYMYPQFIQLIIRNQLGDLSTHTTKYTSPALTQKVFANMRRVRKGFSWIETPLFKGIRVKNLEYDKLAQDLEITKLKRRVKKLEKGNKVKALKLRRLHKVGTSQRIDTSDDTVMEDVSNQGRMIDDLDKDDALDLMDDKGEEMMEEEVKDDQVKGRQAEIYKIYMDHASKVLSMQEDDPAEVREVVDVVTTAKLITEVVTAASESVTVASTTISAAKPHVPAATITTSAPVRVVAASTRRRKGVVNKDPEEESTTIIPADTKSKDNGKGIMVEKPKPLKKKQQVEMDEEYARKLHENLNKDIDWNVAIEHVKKKAKEDPFVQRYQVIKKRPQTKAQARKNMIMYLKNVAGFRLDYFKGMSYDDIHPIFEAKFNSNIAFLLKTKRQLEEEENRAIQSINETPAQKAAKRRRLNEEVEDLKRHLENVPDEDDDVYTEATPLERKMDKIKSGRVKGLSMVKQRLKARVRLRVEEQSEMSLELLRFTKQQHQEGQLE